jgi:hypothetical protein
MRTGRSRREFLAVLLEENIPLLDEDNDRAVGFLLGDNISS